jgi:hypothetical protein
MSYPQRKQLVKDLYSRKSVNLLAGHSGAGKTRLDFQMLLDMIHGRPVLGYPCLEPIKPIYFCYDRLIESVYETLNTMGISFEGLMPIRSLAIEDFASIPTLEMVRGYNFIVLDGVDAIVPPGKIIDFGAISAIIRKCLKLANESDACLSGLLGTGKKKGDGSGYVLSREKLIGSTSWGRMSDNIIVIEGIDTDLEDKYRTIEINLRNGPKQRLNYMFDSNGWLVPNTVNIQIELPNRAKTLLSVWPEEDIVQTEILIGLNQKLSSPLSRTTFFEALKDLRQHNIIERIGDSEYRLKTSKPN